MNRVLNHIYVAPMAMFSLAMFSFAVLGCDGKDVRDDYTESTEWELEEETNIPEEAETKTITVMFVYTADMKYDSSNAARDLAATFDAYILYANSVLENSSVLHEVANAGSLELSDTEASICTELPSGEWRAGALGTWLGDELEDEFSEIAIKRDALNADLVYFIVETDFEEEVDEFGVPTGVTYTGNANSVAGRDADAYKRPASVGHYNSGEQLFIHEIGHLMGAKHDWDTDDKTCAVDGPELSRGFYDCSLLSLTGTCLAGVRTTMAYNATCSDELGASCTLNPSFSNPNLMVGSLALGTEDCEFNACALQQLGLYVSQFDEFMDDPSTVYSVSLHTECPYTLDSFPP